MKITDRSTFDEATAVIGEFEPFDRPARLVYRRYTLDRIAEPGLSDRARGSVAWALLAASLATAAYAAHAAAGEQLFVIYAGAAVLAFLDAVALVMTWWRREASRYVAGLVATALLLPTTAILIAVTLYLTLVPHRDAGLSMAVMGWRAPFWGLIIAVEAWLAIAFLGRGLARADKAIPSSYEELQQRLSQVDATLLVTQSEPQNGHPEARVARERALDLRNRIESDLARVGPSWVLGTGYAAVWERVYRVEEALIELAPEETVLAGAVYDDLRLQGSNIATREELRAKLRQAVPVLDPGAMPYLIPAVGVTAPLTITPRDLPEAPARARYAQTLAAAGGKPPYTWTAEGALPPGMSLSPTGLLSGTPENTGTSSFKVRVTDSASQMVEAPVTLTFNATRPAAGGRRVVPGNAPGGAHGDVDAPEAQARAVDARSMARVILRTVRRSINEFRNGSWIGMILARNHLLETMVLTGMAVFVLLAMPMIWNVAPEHIFAASVFYMVGAAVGLFDRLRRESQTEAAGFDYGLSVSRLATIPLFSGLGAIVGVLLTSLLPNFDPLSGPSTAAPGPLAIAAAPTSIECQVARSCSALLEASGGQRPYRWTVSEGALPDALVLSPAGVLSGTPTGTGSEHFTARVADGAGSMVEKRFAVAIQAPAPDQAAAELTVDTPTPLPAAVIGRSYSGRLQAVGGVPPYDWKFEGATPHWLTLGQDGTLSGTPSTSTAVGFSAVATAADGSASKPRKFTLAVGPEASAPFDEPPSGRAPSLGAIFDLKNSLCLLVAAVFGLTPGLVFDRLQSQGEKYRADLKSSQVTEGSPKS